MKEAKCQCKKCMCPNEVGWGEEVCLCCGIGSHWDAQRVAMETRAVDARIAEYKRLLQHALDEN